MQFKHRTEAEVEILDLSGKITIGEGEAELRRTVQGMIDEGHKKILLSLDEGKKKFVVNLEKVTFMDSAGIGELVACHKRAVEKGGVIKILKANEKMLDLFAITKLIEIFDLFTDEKEALKSF